MLLRKLLRLGRTPEAPLCNFKVDDVRPSTKSLPTEPFVPAVSQKLGREIFPGFTSQRRLVRSFANNSLFGAVQTAFGQHYPLTLSPDVIWLTIAQGFAHHITENPEIFRKRLVRHEGILELVEQLGEVTPDALQQAVAGFSSQIRDATDPAIHDTLVCDFSTSTPEIRTASEIVLMDTYSRYFEYSMDFICGIPSISLTGTVADWHRIRERIEVLETFDLAWWMVRLRPILDEFVTAAMGQPNRDFWKGIYTFGIACPPLANGWLVDLFPYLGDAPNRRQNQILNPKTSRMFSPDAIPTGVCSVPVNLRLAFSPEQVEYPLDLVAGLVGLEQASDNLAVSPVISWCLAARARATDNLRNGANQTSPGSGSAVS
ncbi:MAG: DUF4419 domain-containing protein [Bryobacteraceae bacterium]|nr:DUF4419 domain-containing protein [Bryobacteraceae bacterium]